MIGRLFLGFIASLSLVVGGSTAANARDTCVVKIIPGADFASRITEIQASCDEGNDINVEVWQQGLLGLVIVNLCDLEHSVVTIPAENGRFTDLICRVEWKEP